MRYAVLSDIHGNLEALTAAMEALAAERIDRYLCLGDVMGYGADPTACLERLRSRDPVVVGGNHDLACVGKLDLAWFNDAARAALMWTRDQLGFTDLDWLRRLPLTETVDPFTPYHGSPAPLQQVVTGSARGTGFTLVHSSLRHPERFEYLADLAQAVDAMAACRTLMCLAGHTHLACVIEYDRTRRRIERFLTAPAELTDVTFRNDADGVRYLVNPGSVGQPRDGDPRASFAIIDTERQTLCVHRVRYDVETAARKIRQAGLPGFLADRLALGR